MNRHWTLAALIILLALVVCSQTAAKPGRFAPYFPDDNGGSHRCGDEMGRYDAREARQAR
jgi:hypothetical protein